MGKRIRKSDRCFFGYTGSIFPMGITALPKYWGSAKKYDYALLKKAALEIYDPGHSTLQEMADALEVSKFAVRKALGKDFIPKANTHRIGFQQQHGQGRPKKKPVKRPARNYDDIYEDPPDDGRVTLEEFLENAKK